MLRTAVLCAALLGAAYASAAWLTHDFQVWTAEGARRLEVALAPVPAPAFAVEGPQVAERDLQSLLANGRDVSIVEFFYSNCQTVCLVQGTIFQQMQPALQEANSADAARVKLLAISFDPQRDTPPALAAYARRMEADPKHWRFVRLPDVQDTRKLLSAFQVVVVPNDFGDYEHNGALLVVDAQGRLVRVFDLAEQQLALDYARHIAAGDKS
jgi:protein SCO1/2